MAKVKIKKLPKALSGLEIKMQPGLYGTNGNRQFTLPTQVNSQKFAQQPTEVRNTLQPVPRSEANLEAEKGETALINIDGIPAHFKIGGKRHSQGGTPLSLPDNSFIFSDTAKMKIKDPNILAQFGMSAKKGGYTPAEIAKKYDINTYRKILSDPNTEDIERKTAERMIANYNMKLAKLGLAQESMKGFPQGIPVIAMPYIDSNNVNPADYFPTQGQEDQPDADTGEARYGGNIIAQFRTKKYGGLLKAQDGYAAGYMPEGYPGTTLPEVEVTAPFDYVGKGFSGKKEEELAFATDPKTKAAYMAYRDAMRSKDPVLLRNTLASLEKTSALPFSKITDLRGVLREELGEKSFKQKISEFFNKGEKQKREQYKEEKEKVIPKAYVLYGKLKSLAEDPSISSIERNNYNNLLKEAESLLPEYKNSWLAKQARAISPLKFFSNQQKVYEKNKDGQLEEVDPMYNQAEIDYIDLQLEQLKNAESKLAKTKKPVILKEVAEDPVKKSLESKIDFYNPTEEQINNLSDDEYNYLLRLYDRPEFKDLYKSIFGEQAYGGSIYKYGGLPKAQKGRIKPKTESTGTTKTVVGPSGTPEQPYTTAQAFDKIGIDNLNKLRSQFGLPPVDYGNPKDPAYQQKVKQAAGEMQAAASQQYPELVKDYMTNRGITPTAALSGVLGPRGYGKKIGDRYRLTPADLQKAIKEGKVTDDEILKGYQDNLWHYRGLTLDKKKLKKDEYEKKMKEASIAKDNRRFFSDDPNSPYKYTEYEMEEEPAKDPAKPAPPVATKEERKPENQVVNRYPPGQQPIVPADAPWWLQDIIKVSGAAADLARVKKYQPWQATPGYSLPDATFYDPTRELAANTEAANVAMQAQQAFSNPQQLAAASSVAQGQMAKNAADIMGRYNNLNVGLANQLNQQRSDIVNTASANQAAMNTQLYDKYTIANQQFDNSKALARQKLRQSYIDGITNKAKTQALNSLYPNFYTDPTSGGNVYPNPYYTPNPTVPSSDNEYDAAFEKYGPQGIDSYLDWKYGRSKKGRSRNRYEDYQGYPGTSGSYAKTAEEEEE